VDTKETPNKYNVVATNKRVSLMKNDIKNWLVDWVLSKHVLIANYDEEVRFAGEIWKDIDGVIWVSANSGTYTPNKEQLDNFLKYLCKVFPNAHFKAHYWRD
jgi:hypothetical protein